MYTFTVGDAVIPHHLSLKSALTFDAGSVRVRLELLPAAARVAFAGTEAGS